MAAYKGHLEVVKALIRAKAEINAADNQELTALMCAVHKGQIPCVRFLLQAGANREHKNCASQTAYDLAQQLEDDNTREKILRLLNQ